MSIASTDIVIYGAANIAENDSNTQGGAIDTTIRYIFDDADLVNDPTTDGGDGTLIYVSDNAGDNMNITVTGRDISGSIVSETKAINNTTPVAGTQVFERILKIVLASAASGSITVSDSLSNTLLTIEAGVTTVRRPFYNASSDLSSEKNYYEKVFVRNNHATLSLLGATFIESSDPTTNLEFALEDAVNDNSSVANRLTAPAAGDLGSSGFSSDTKYLTEIDAGTADLAAGSAIGIFLKLNLPAAEPATKSYYTIQISGSSI